jgi:hypothetical protein
LGCQFEYSFGGGVAGIDKFWPGSLTVVAKANRTVVPDIDMAHTGYVACRSPSHALARQLLTCARVPIAAPSANRFGHVSPTCPTHVMDDLSSEDIWIIDPNLNKTLTNHNGENNEESMTNARCDVGVESTVAKDVSNNNDNWSWSDKEMEWLQQAVTKLRLECLIPFNGPRAWLVPIASISQNLRLKHLPHNNMTIQTTTLLFWPSRIVSQGPPAVSSLTLSNKQ